MDKRQRSAGHKNNLTSLLQRSEITGIVGKAVSTAEATVDAETKGALLLLDAVEAAGDDTGGCCKKSTKKVTFRTFKSLPRQNLIEQSRKK